MLETSKSDFFISYNRLDQHWGEWIAWQLEDAGFSVLIQSWDFRPGSNFILELQKAATEAERTIIVLSKDYLDDLYTQPEWAAAFAQDPTGSKRILLPVRVHPCELKGLLYPLVYIDLVGQEEVIAQQRLLEGIRRDRGMPKAAPAFPGREKHLQTIFIQKSLSETHSFQYLRPPFPAKLAPAPKPIELFYLFAPEDEDLRAELERQLALLRHLGLISGWHSGKIRAGQERTSEIEIHLDTARIILLLISANFIASDTYMMVGQAMERHKRGSAYVLPIILSPVDWDGTPFDQLAVLPTNRKPVTSWLHRDEAFLDIAKEIRNIVEDLTILQ